MFLIVSLILLKPVRTFTMLSFSKMASDAILFTISFPWIPICDGTNRKLPRQPGGDYYFCRILCYYILSNQA